MKLILSLALFVVLASSCSKKKCLKCEYKYETFNSYSYKEDELCDKESKVDDFEADFKDKYKNEPGTVSCSEQ